MSAPALKFGPGFQAAITSGETFTFWEEPKWASLMMPRETVR